MSSSAKTVQPSLLPSSSDPRDAIKSRQSALTDQLMAVEDVHQAEQLLLQGHPLDALEAYTVFIISASHDKMEERDRALQEAAILRAAQLLPEDDAQALATFIRRLEPVWVSFPRAKSAKLIKDLLAFFDRLPTASEPTHDEGCRQKSEQQRLLEELIDWCERDQRAFLKQSLQLRLAELFLTQRQFTECLQLTEELILHFRRLDDKLSLVQANLLLSRAYFALKNVAKSRAALTAARTNANAVYCPPELLGRIDLQTGLLHAEETDFSPAFSYFVESLDNFCLAQQHPLGKRALKYQLLCKIMLGARLEELDALCAGKNARHYHPLEEREVQAMRAIGEAYQTRSIGRLESALDAYPDALGYDPIIQSHFAALYDKLLEQNILKIIANHERIHLATIAAQLHLEHNLAAVEGKLCQMIIDAVISGIIDQHTGYLLLLPRNEPSALFSEALNVLDNLHQSVQALRGHLRQ
jgi:26S proteasome regulatory subunit N6